MVAVENKERENIELTTEAQAETPKEPEQVEVFDAEKIEAEVNTAKPKRKRRRRRKSEKTEATEVNPDELRALISQLNMMIPAELRLTDAELNLLLVTGSDKLVEMAAKKDTAFYLVVAAIVIKRIPVILSMIRPAEESHED